MSIALPYIPNLTLGGIVDPSTMKTLLAMSEATGKIDVAHDHLNSQISMKRSLEMTAQELENLHIDTETLTGKLQEVNKNIDEAAANYAKVRMEQEAILQPLRASAATVNASYESPINWMRSEIKKLDLGADSIKLNVQYFAFDRNKESVDNQLSSIRSFIGASGRFLGIKASTEIASTAVKQINNQIQTHDIEGTLIITATCTHRDVAMFAPLVIDVDKAIRVWNQMHPDKKDRIITDDWSLSDGLAEEGTEQEKAIHIISGSAFGSSFVGMVHILRQESTNSSQSTANSAQSVQIEAGLAGGALVSSLSGGFGVDRSTLDDIRRLFSRTEIDSHVTLITAGMIPSIASNEIVTSIQAFTEFDPAGMMKQLSALQSNTESSQSSLQSNASAAKAGGQLVAMQQATINSVMSSVSAIDIQKNKVLNINSMLTAFENYLGQVGGKSADGKQRTAGSLPVQYYIKPITKSQLIHMWMNKYYPGQFLEIQGDDSQAKPSK